MDSAKRPTEAIAELLAEELRCLIRALPDELKDAVPEHLKQDTRFDEEGETP
jgi:hypothetical protein